MNNLHPLAWSPNPLIEAAQTGDRLMYHPETARAELGAFAQRYSAAMEAVDKLSTSLVAKAKEPAAHPTDANDNDRRRQATSEMKRVKADLKDGMPPSTFQSENRPAAKPANIGQAKGQSHEAQ